MSAEDQGRTRAEEFRAEHRLGHVPLPDLVSLIELTQDIDVAVLDADPDEHGLTMRDPVRDVVVVAVARTRSPMRQRSTLAHELGHVLFGDFGLSKAGEWDKRSPQEIRADAFARHLLVPLEGLGPVLADRSPGESGAAGADAVVRSPTGELMQIEVKRHRGRERVSLSELSALVQRFKASPSLVAIQLNKVGLISPARKSEWMALSTRNLASRFGWSDLYEGWQQESASRRAPQRLLSRAIQGYVANVVSLQAVARLRGLPVEQIAAEFEDAGIIPDAVEPVPPPAAADNRPDTDFSDLDALDDLVSNPGSIDAPTPGPGAHGE
ncbi:ImmA/IrrE family metallo-endopeptidase [Streptomyces sp. SID13031]|uniref:ImmA/IrrE family metallo-endopeptidase n=1 Tax=Streptomyces sp. SID13031 TaxID=2706046 RepID=UPI0013CB4049|nr:ImmA/IrrE family metallo-endopeptidase [Streptomyces sp. SID13031]NEA36260.1 ImmA/IrrE family metallo-endopeptidase [Streptomyces sp. SID13031]